MINHAKEKKGRTSINPKTSISEILRGPDPLYRRIKEQIITRVRSGEWPVGHRIPSENKLVEELGVSRMTVNRALRELSQEGYLARVQGVGTFVKELPQQSSLLELRNIAEEIKAQGHVHKARIEHRAEVVADHALAERMEIALGDPVFHIVLVHHSDDLPVQLEDRYVNPAVAPDFMAQSFLEQTPTQYLLDTSPVDELEHRVCAIMASPRQLELLDIAAHEPCLALHRRSWSVGRVVTSAVLIYPASRYELHSRYATTPTGRLGPPT